MEVSVTDYRARDFKCLHVKSERVWHLSFQEEYLNMNWNGNLDSTIGKCARLVIWRSEVQIPVQVRIFLLKSKLLINIFTHFPLVSYLNKRNSYPHYQVFWLVMGWILLGTRANMQIQNCDSQIEDICIYYFNFKLDWNWRLVLQQDWLLH